MENGKVALIGGIGIDITERQTLQEQLTQARKWKRWTPCRRRGPRF